MNGLTWTDDGAYIVSAGHDRQIRVWDAAAGANTVASFGPTIRNDYNGRLTMFVSPIGLTPQKKDLLFYPNENEILVMDLHEGTIIIRLRGMGPCCGSYPCTEGRTNDQKFSLQQYVPNNQSPFRLACANVGNSRLERS